MIVPVPPPFAVTVVAAVKFGLADRFSEVTKLRPSVPPPVAATVVAPKTIPPAVDVKVRDFACRSMVAAAFTTMSSVAVTITLLIANCAFKVPSVRLPVPESAKGPVAGTAQVPPPTQVMLPDVLAARSLVIVMEVGSSSNIPVCPRGALVFTRPAKSKVCFPDTSTKPPSPPWLPPRAEIDPKNLVVPSAQTITLPPCPVSTASASTRAVGAT